LKLQKRQYVVTYDNGTGYREYASKPQDTQEAAWAAAGIKPGEQYFNGSDPILDEV
jgi:hypothetical protein